MTIGDQAIALVERHPAVRRVRLVGSRASGRPTALSDWDFAVDTNDFQHVSRDIDSLLAPLHPLAQQWDRLSGTWCWMVILEGPIKLDFIFVEPHQPEPQWQPAAANLAEIDRHFWDWMLWLAAKQMAGQAAVVRRELEKVWVNLLSPMAADHRPVALDDAVGIYLTVRDQLERRFNVSLPRALEREVRPALDNALRAP